MKPQRRAQLPEEQKPQEAASTTSSIPRHKTGAVRHAEKRRTGTCRFADRIATASLDCFRKHIPASFRETQKQTCVATIVSHFESDGYLQVQSLGVGTKFLPESLLQEEELSDELSSESTAPMVDIDGHAYPQSYYYGCRVRDCHAEVLTRRAFRLQLYLELMENQLRVPSTSHHRTILEATQHDTDRGKFRLKPGVTLHMYSSSTPCGNATIKRFATMKKEVFDEEMDPNEWPSGEHQEIGPHALKLGQFSLLLKKDRNVTDATFARTPLQTAWPSNQNDDWCPPGTTIVWSKQGSIHTCSDKICRWNVLGLQGSLLASVLESPLYMKTLTVGRKFTECICRRAICCRATEVKKKKRKGTTVTKPPVSDEISPPSAYSLHHPAVMGTGVYMDDSGTLGMSDESEFGQDVRFNSLVCYAWCPGLGDDVECLDGLSGWAVNNDKQHVSRISTASLIRLHGALRGCESVSLPTSLGYIRSFKKEVSPDYEGAKEELLSSHRMFRGWRRRGLVTENNADKSGFQIESSVSIK